MRLASKIFGREQSAAFLSCKVLPHMMIPKSQQCYPAGVLPAHKFYDPAEPPTEGE
jgi:hypothetical protein